MFSPNAELEMNSYPLAYTCIPPGQFGQKDLTARVLALELSAELRDIYSHPHWIKFMDLLKTITTDASRHVFRYWAETHHLLMPMIQWFHQCTAKYGLRFDVFTYLPPSRLILQDQCCQKISQYQTSLQTNQQKLKYYQELQQLLNRESSQHCPTVLESDEYSSAGPAYSSCWDVLVESSSQNSPTNSCHQYDYLFDQPRQQAFVPPTDCFRLPPAASTVLTKNTNTHF